jgi:hypothetical protein
MPMNCTDLQAMAAVLFCAAIDGKENAQEPIKAVP